MVHLLDGLGKNELFSRVENVRSSAPNGINIYSNG